ncbi:MAG: hypothetical protein HF981_18820 [Desulfobacteraceae bacterium]|nr:hypothetical protein [Desulfobacteraceae bacterium]MBC2752452.1 hypothetical protein [Desulfobacteraceae bacterium]
MRTSVRPDGRFRVARHQPSYRVANLRPHERVCELGRLADGRPVTNQQNFPEGVVDALEAESVFEIANPFPFRGTTYIGKTWADDKRRDPSAICLPPRPAVSMRQWLCEHCSAAVSTTRLSDLLKTMPEPVQLSLAVNSTDPDDLIPLAEAAGDFVYDSTTGRPAGLRFVVRPDGSVRPRIYNSTLFEAVANNVYLPDDYKDAMVLRPGAQGGSAIVAEWRGGNGSHVYEYLRRNSYIPWGHYAANMANDAVRYQPEELTMDDMTGMRHLYYQRTYVRLAEMMGLPLPPMRQSLTAQALERLRLQILARFHDTRQARQMPFNGGLWGWNLGFDYAPSRYRLHASHQQVHQQYALIPRHAPSAEGATNDETGPLPAYACGDLIHDFIRAYRRATGVDFFTAYIDAIHHNQRTDGRAAGPHELIVHKDENVMLFVPKAQTSQWELQLVALAPVGNIMEADSATRRSLDRALLTAVQTLGRMGARMITTIEYAKRFDAGDTGQHLLYSFLPRLPESPGAFSEAQQRWIIGHYPEDFAAACRMHSPVPASA